MRRLSYFLFVLFLSFLALACGGSSGSDSDSGQDATEFRTMCGAVTDAQLQSEVPMDKLEKVSVEVSAPDELLVTRTEKNAGQQLVKLLGVSSDNIGAKLRSDGVTLVKNLTESFAYLLIADEEAEVYVAPNAARGIYAQLFSPDGRSISEELLANAYTKPSKDALFSDQLFDCYSGLEGIEDTSASFPSTCGAFVGGALENPIRTSRLELVSVKVESPDFLVVTLLGGSSAGQEIGIKLHGVSINGVSDFLIQNGLERLAELVNPNAYLLRSGPDCIFDDGTGGRATLAQLFSVNGENINEELIKIGALQPSNNGCSAGQLVSCYNTLEVSAPEPPVEPEPDNGGDGDNGDVFTDTEIDDFLWKPVSESTGNLVILVNVRDVRVRVIGNSTEDLVNTGPSNGRGTTARASRPGCSFGRDITVQFFDSNGDRVILKDGRKSVNISNGCDRVEFKL